MGWNAKKKASEMKLPTLEEIEAIYLEAVLNITGSVIETSRVLGLSRRTVAYMLARHGIKHPVKEAISLSKELKKEIAMSKGEVTYSVTPEERDFYYNLDFLRGRYPHITHALGIGEDEG
jgi:predicted DNA-binding protein (UPF0251 family)